MIVKKDIDVNKPLTPEQKKRIAEAAKHEIVYDEDCPELTEEQLSRFKRVNPPRKVGLG